MIESIRTFYEIKSIDDLKQTFPNGEANSLNWCLFSTSGIHGSYTTLDEIEYSLRNNIPEIDEDGNENEDYYPPLLTVLVIKPRILQVGYGEIEIDLDDMPYLRRLAQSSIEIIAKSQDGNLE